MEDKKKKAEIHRLEQARNKLFKSWEELDAEQKRIEGQKKSLMKKIVEADLEIKRIR